MITRETFGVLGARQCDLLRITNVRGASVALIPVGARIVEAHLPDRHGRLDDVVLGFDSIEEFLGNRAYAGATCGRYSNRLAGARFELDGETFEVDCNRPPNHLHGGFAGLDQQYWDYEIDGTLVRFSHVSPDGHGGYPGELTSQVTYAFDDDNVLAIEMTATTTRPTIVNLVNHAYWNLAGHGSGSILSHDLVIHAQAYTPVDEGLLPTGEVLPVEGTRLDFREPRAIGMSPGGYDNNWVIDGPRHVLRAAATAVDPLSGRCMTVMTTEAGVQLYTAGHLSGEQGKAGAAYDAFAGFALETQALPSSPTHPHFPSTVLRPGETYCHRMELHFGLID